jgi:hypothetical protein
MGKIALFTAAVAVFFVIGIDAWLCIRTMPPSALAGSTFNPLSVATGAMSSHTSHYDDYLFAPQSGE